MAQDTVFNMWRLSWIAEALTTEPARLLDPPIFHPATRALAFSDAVLLQGLLATPLLAAGAPIFPVSNAMLLLGPWLSALAMYLLVRDLLAGRAGTEMRGSGRGGGTRRGGGRHPARNRRTRPVPAPGTRCRHLLACVDRRDDLRPAAVPGRAPHAPGVQWSH